MSEGMPNKQFYGILAILIMLLIMGFIFGYATHDEYFCDDGNFEYNMDDVLVIGTIQEHSVPNNQQANCFVVISDSSGLPYFLKYNDDYFYGGSSFIFIVDDVTVNTWYVGDPVIVVGDIEVVFEPYPHSVIHVQQIDENK